MHAICVPPRPYMESLEWLLGSADAFENGNRVYIDGSATDPTEPEFTRLGFAIVVVDDTGLLLAVLRGVPPPWIRDSAGAETWAFYIALSLAPVAPPIVTDCLGLLQKLRDGPKRAMSESQPLARVWALIFHALDSPTDTIECYRKMCWMPSHVAKCKADQRFKSDGTCVTAIDWRANRVADAAAKSSAMAHRPSAELLKKLKHFSTGITRA